MRGLGAQFTRVRVNGLETVATSTDGASANRDRAFDFNVFASELFSSHRRPQDRRGLARRGLAWRGRRSQHRQPARRQDRLHARRLGAGELQRSVEDAGARASPGCCRGSRPTARSAWRVSAAYQKTDNLELGNNTVRWAQARFDSVNGTPCFYSTQHERDAAWPMPAASTVPSAACDQAGARLPPAHPALRRGRARPRAARASPAASNGRRPTRPRCRSTALFALQGGSARRNGPRCCCARTSGRSTCSTRSTMRTTTWSSATLNDAWVRTEHYLRQSKTEILPVRRQLGSGRRPTTSASRCSAASRSRTPTSRSRRRSSSTIATRRATSSTIPTAASRR